MFGTESTGFPFVDGTSEGVKLASGLHLQQQSKPLREAHNDLEIFSMANARKMRNLVRVDGMDEGAGF